MSVFTGDHKVIVIFTFLVYVYVFVCSIIWLRSFLCFVLFILFLLPEGIQFDDNLDYLLGDEHTKVY